MFIRKKFEFLGISTDIGRSLRRVWRRLRERAPHVWRLVTPQRKADLHASPNKLSASLFFYRDATRTLIDTPLLCAAE